MQINITLAQQTFLIFMNQKFQFMIFTLANDHFYCLTFKCDLDLQLTRINASNKHLCQIILKSLHKCRSYGPDKPNLWPFYYLTFKCDLDLQPTWTKLSNEQLCLMILKSMHKWRSYGPEVKRWPFYNLTSSVTLTFNLPKHIFKWLFYS